MAQSQITFTANVSGANNVDMEVRRAVYEDTTFVGWWLEKENPIFKMSSTQYEITLPLHNQYVVTFMDPTSEKWKVIYIGTGNESITKNAFTVTADFCTTDGFSILNDYETNMYMSRTIARSN
jgi:hypothetical protein